MEILLQLFREEEIKEIVRNNKEIKNLTKEDLRKSIKYLADLGCNNRIMRNIIKSNPFYLTRDMEDVEELIEKIRDYSINHIELMLDTYPFLLNKNAYEIDGFFIKKRQEGLSEEETKELLELEPYLIEE